MPHSSSAFGYGRSAPVAKGGAAGQGAKTLVLRHGLEGRQVFQLQAELSQQPGISCRWAECKEQLAEAARSALPA